MRGNLRDSVWVAVKDQSAVRFLIFDSRQNEKGLTVFLQVELVLADRTGRRNTTES